MAGLYTSQGWATKQFGIEFRSKLEASWAYALGELRLDGMPIPWDYVDSPWHDFVLRMPWGDARIEVKPAGAAFAFQAILRIPDGNFAFIVQGEPGEIWEGRNVKGESSLVMATRIGDAFFVGLSRRWFDHSDLKSLTFAISHAKSLAPGIFVGFTREQVEDAIKAGGHVD